MPTDQHKEWVQKNLGVKNAAASRSSGGAAATGGSKVRPSEIVAGASGVQYSYGENTAEATTEGGDFADSSRANAEENDHSQAYSGYAGGSNPMQSPNLGASGDFALRYGIGFLCSKYPKGWGNLGDIADYSKPSSTYLRAFSGLAKTQQFQNPSRSQFMAGIADWVSKLSKALPAGAQGELVVSCQGHGAHGSFFTSDGGEVTAAQLITLAKTAEKSRVSVTFVLDACFSGGAVPEFQDHAADSVDGQVDENVEGAGQVCSEDNHARAEELRTQMAHARELILFSRAVAGHGDKLNGLVQTVESANTEAAWDAAMAENRIIIQLVESMQNQFRTNMNFGNNPEMKLDQITSAFGTVLTQLNGIQPQTCFDYNQWTGAVGKFQDQISDGANRIIKILQKASQPA